jgi:hypothetical protein
VRYWKQSRAYATVEEGVGVDEVAAELVMALDLAFGVEFGNNEYGTTFLTLGGESPATLRTLVTVSA